MTRARPAAAIGVALVATLVASCASRIAAVHPGPVSGAAEASSSSIDDRTRPGDTLQARLDAALADPALARALVSVRVESLTASRELYTRQPGALVMPASVMKIVTAAVAAERLGWEHRFTTRLEHTGSVSDGVLAGDLVVTGEGDPSIAAQDLRSAPLFLEWAQALRSAGIRRIDGRILGDDRAFDDEGLGAGWAWDYLAAGYAAPSGALSYNENVAVLRIGAAASDGSLAAIEMGPPGHGLEVINEVMTTPANIPASIALSRLPGSQRLTIRGTVPVGSGTLVRTTAIDNPTAYFVEALRLALIESGIIVSGAAVDADTVPAAALGGRRHAIADHRSAPLSSLIGYAMKVSQNFYGDMLLKAIGRSAPSPGAGPNASGGADGTSVVGSAESGRQIVRQAVAAWNLPVDSLVMADGSGLSRYNYVSADLLVGVLKRMWTDERLRGPFVASLPVGGHDGTLEARMRNTPLDRRVQAKTGTISNVRSLAGYALTASGDRLVFAIVANHFTAPTAQIDAVTERLLEELVR